MNRNHTNVLGPAALPVLLLWALLWVCPARAQDSSETNLWQDAGEAQPNLLPSETWVRPDVFHSFNLQHSHLRPLLGQAPKESAQPLASSGALISLPMPDGTLARFRFVESPVMHPALAARFPEIKTYRGRGIDDPAATVRFDLTPAGFHAQILSPRGAVYIEPYLRGNTNLHVAFYRRDYRPSSPDFECLISGSMNAPTASASAAATPLAVPGGNLRTYRLACAATAEYTAYFGGTVPAGLAAMVTALNRVTGVYETEVGICLVLVADNDLIIYTNAATEPYSNGNPSALLTQNQANLDSVIGSANYDIGHVFGTAGGGLAAVGVAGVAGLKAEGETGTYPPVGDAFYIDYVAHEMGHQFGATHPFNSSLNACGYGNRWASTAYEPGSGSTIMSYAGICSTDNLQANSDPYFHSASLEQILGYITTGAGSSSASVTSTGNSGPAVNAGPSFTIPMGTPFTLTATGSDSNVEAALTYCWEELDLGPSITLRTPDNGSSPLFRSFNPTTNTARTFPQWSSILNGATTPGEMLPTTSRTMNFRVTVRDNVADGGSTAFSTMQVTVTTNAGPFVVTAPAAGVTWSGGQTITWNVAGTADAPVNAAGVNILLSTNGGLSFPIVLASNAPNVGACNVLLPQLACSTVRIEVQAAGNIFFAVSPGNFSLVAASPPVLQPLQLSNGVARLAWSAIPGQTYRVQYKPALAAANWTDLPPDITATNSTASTTDAPGSAPQRFYRVLLLP